MQLVPVVLHLRAENKQYWHPAEIPWVKTGEVTFAPITQTEEAISKAALDECSLTLLPPDTVLIAMYGQGKNTWSIRTSQSACDNQSSLFCDTPK